MNYWQFKFKKEKENFKELKDLQDGAIFFTEITENHILKEVGTETVVFWSRTDKEKGIMLVSKIIGEPYESDEVSSAKAIPMKVIKKFEKPFVLEDNGFKNLHNKLNTLKYKRRVQSRARIDNDTGQKLVNKILQNLQEPNTVLEKIDSESIKKTLKLFSDNYNQYIEEGKRGDFYNIFIEANIAGQEIRHSSYLANLLDIKGNHFQDNLFLNYFIQELLSYDEFTNSEAILNFDINKYKVTTEEHHKDEEDTGLMDIVLEDDNYAIIIENKTGTKDSKGQLLKYKKFAESKGLVDYVILYLTPNGDDATDENALEDEKIHSISYIDTIQNMMRKSLNYISNEKLHDIINQYIESVQLYTYNLSIDWKYELNTVELIISDKELFEQCKVITRLVNYNIINEYNYFSELEIDMAKWIAKYFIKSKSHLERLFFVNLHNEIRNILENQSFYISGYSNILRELFQDDGDIDITIAKDVETISYARKNSLLKPKNKSEEYFDKLREKSKSCLVYENIIDENNALYITIQKDISGFYIEVEKIDNSQYIQSNVKYLFEDIDFFNSYEIEKFLDEEILSKFVEVTKIKIQTMLMEID